MECRRLHIHNTRTSFVRPTENNDGPGFRLSENSGHKSGGIILTPAFGVNRPRRRRNRIGRKTTTIFSNSVDYGCCWSEKRTAANVRDVHDAAVVVVRACRSAFRGVPSARNTLGTARRWTTPPATGNACPWRTCTHTHVNTYS